MVAALGDGRMCTILGVHIADCAILDRNTRLVAMNNRSRPNSLMSIRDVSRPRHHVMAGYFAARPLRPIAM